ncbi:MAG: DUF72 domain-containing protein [Fervidicoccaceae archaeon]
MATKPEIYVGTSGWLYDWNPEGTLDWYVSHSGLNAVELNASFYRFPSVRHVSSWARRGSALRWSVKFHKSISHIYRLNEKAAEIASRFLERFEPLDRLVDFYLLQMPPTFARTRANEERVEKISSRLGLGRRLAIEFRHASWFSEEGLAVVERANATVVSVDSPDITWIEMTGDAVYLRMHGRATWYAHDYELREIEELLRSALSIGPAKLYIFFNNNHWMLKNAREALRLAMLLSSERP